MSIMPVEKLDSKSMTILLFKYGRDESVEKFFLNPD